MSTSLRDPFLNEQTCLLRKILQLLLEATNSVWTALSAALGRLARYIEVALAHHDNLEEAQ
jgi:hypothetical protein